MPRLGCTLAVALGLAGPLAAQIPLPLDLDGLKRLAENARSGAAPGLRGQLVDAAARAQAAGDRLSHAHAHAGLAALEEFTGRVQRAEHEWRTAVATAADLRFAGPAARWLAELAAQQGRLPRGRIWAKRATDAYRLNHDEVGLAHALHAEAKLAPAGAERQELLRQALVGAEAGGDAHDLALIRTDWGESQRQAGDLAGAIATLQAATAALVSLGDRSATARARTFLGRVYYAHGKHQDALRELEQADTLLSGDSNSSIAVTTRLDLARVLARLGARSRALKILDEMRAQSDLPRDAQGNGGRVSLLAHGYFALGEYQRTADLLEAQFRATPRLAAGANYWVLSAAYFHLGRYGQGVAAATSGLTRNGQESSLATVSSYRWRALSLDRLGRHAEAAEDMLTVVRLGRAVLDRLSPDDESKRGFTEARQQIADDVVAVLCRAGRPREALEAAENFRARAFLDLLANRDDAAGTALAAPVVVADLIAQAAATRSPILSYYVHPNMLHAWIIEPGGQIRAVQVPVKAAQLQALATRARRFGYKPDRAAWRELHRLLIEPLRPTGPLLTILPHGPLLEIPFGALLNAASRYLLEDHALRLVPAAAFLSRSSAHSDAGPYLLVGAPSDPHPLPALPGAQRELRRIAALTPGRHHLLGGAGAREQAVMDQAPAAGVIHFATHAVVNEIRPFESYLALSGQDRLTAGEIYQLRLKADLVLLSACRGGAGPVSADGMLGFTRALLYAGAASIIAPLWDIADEPTLRLVEEFYRHYRQGATKSAALRSAQLKLLADLRAGRVSVSTPAGVMTLPEHPALWAGFVLQGAN